MTESIPHYTAHSAANAPPVNQHQNNLQIGICGAHRTGKTTLAKALAKSLGISFVEIGTSQIFVMNGLKPDRKMCIDTRLRIQRQILNHACNVWFEIDEPSYICDRTPIDMMAYTLADIQGRTLSGDQEEILAKYLEDCREATERYFSQLVLVPPSIPIVPDEGKASLSNGYIEHIHALCSGLAHESYVQLYKIERDAIDLDRRVAEVKRYLNV